MAGPMVGRILAAALCLCSGASAAALDIDLFRKLTNSILKVEALNTDGSVSLGTGVVVGHGMVVTNCHVTQRADAIELVKGALRRSVELQSSDIEHDLCLLYSSHVRDDPAVEMEQDKPKVGQAVIAVGFIYGIAPRLGEGEISALYDYDNGKVIRTSASFTSGASGGGLFDQTGRLVGIVAFRARGGESQQFCLPVGWVEDALKRFEGRPVAPLPGSPFWQRAREDQPYFLQAATLEAEQNWPELAAVARQWSFTEANNASSWFVLGEAYDHLHQEPQSIDAYKAALAIDSDFAQGWYRLGLAYAGNGDMAEAERVRGILQGIDRRLASELSRHTGDCLRESVTC
jgi:serine protease Do